MEYNVAIVDKNPAIIRAAFKSIKDNYTFKYFNSFTNLITNLKISDEEDEREETSQLEKQENGDETSSDSKKLREYEDEEAFKPLDLLIMDLDLIDQHPLNWINELHDQLDIYGAQPESGTTKIIITCFESTAFKAQELRHHSLFDVFYKPLDAQLILQKFEMITALPELVNPGHLYSHKVEDSIEIYKTSQLLKISEYGLTILNSRQLRQGSFVFFRFFLDSQKPISIVGRTNKSEPADVANYFNCEFSFFAIKKEELSKIRQYIRSRLNQKTNVKIDLPDNKDEEELSAEERALRIKLSITQRAQQGPGIHDKKSTNPAKHINGPKNIILLDMDNENSETVQSLVTQNFSNINFFHFPTYVYFLKNIVQQKHKKDDNPLYGQTDSWIEPAFSFGEKITLTINTQTGEMLKLSPELNENTFICELPVKSFNDAPLYWKNLIPKDSIEQIEELFAYTLSEGKSNLEFKLQNDEGATRWFDLSTKPVAEENTLELTIFDHCEKNNSNNSSEEEHTMIDKVDLIILNTSFIKEDVASWYAELLKTLSGANLIKNYYKIPIILLSPEGKVVPNPDISMRPIFNTVFKPVDRRLLVQHIALIFNHHEVDFDDSYMQSFSFNKKIEIGRSFPIEQISEYGVVLNSPAPIKEGTFLNLHSEILTNQEDGSGTYSRCLASEKHPTEDYYQVYFNYYGVQDAPLKRIREWIREEHVHNKAPKE